MSVTHRVIPRTARWPTPRCPACCDGGGWASWSCSTAWTGTAGSAPSHRTPPGPQEATVRRTRPGETRRKPRRACRCRPAWTLRPRRAKVWRSLTETRIRTPTQFFPLCWLRLCGCYIPGCSWRTEEKEADFFYSLSPNSPPLLASFRHLSDFLSLSLCLFSFLFPLHLSPMIRAWFLLDEKPTPLNPFTTHWHQSLHFSKFMVFVFARFTLLLSDFHF